MKLDANAKHVIGAINLMPCSGRGHTMKLRGAKIMNEFAGNDVPERSIQNRNEILKQIKQNKAKKNKTNKQ